MEWNLDYFFKSKKEFEQEIKTVKKLLSKLLQMNENIVNSLQLEKILKSMEKMRLNHLKNIV